ncbi:hypothetical protein LB521_28000 [Mesorhizobium sp. BR-1-1-8]|uniref:hypothetical protein n=1 Tax=Mesorhizobium sp. BR-1-1-8 TaxID=2876659 RepID=UPI001CCFEB25|nr:hypothetical protein [Mesorhizobium sp. BR-1-1-8]MBZ9984982.1 hypothetical protein [Mesorhizobium sp. BR-1-1-8]
MSADKLIERLIDRLCEISAEFGIEAVNGTENSAKEVHTEGVRTKRALLDLLASIQADNLRLREALTPFGKAAGCHSDDKSFMPDETLIWRGGECAIRLGDLRAARSLSQAEQICPFAFCV